MFRGFSDVRRRGTTVLAWLSLAVAVAGGALAAGMWIGHVVETIVGVFPWPWLAAVLLACGFIGTLIDLFVDGEPNQFAIYSAIGMPSLAASTHGKLAHTVTAWSDGLLRWIDHDLSGWLGTQSSTGLAVAAIVAAILMSRRVVKKSRGGGPGVGRRSRAVAGVI